MKYATLISAVSNVSGASFIGMDTLTSVTLTGGKKNPMQGRVTKLHVGAQVMVFQNKNTNAYQAMIERRLVAEGKDPASFVLSPRAWGTRVPNLPIVEHIKDGATKYYLEVIFLRAGDVQYFLDDMPIAKKDIVGLADREEGAQGGLDDKVVIRSFAADSVVALRIDGQEYA